MILKIKKLIREAVVPNYAKKGDAGLDLIATSSKNCTEPPVDEPLPTLKLAGVAVEPASISV